MMRNLRQRGRVRAGAAWRIDARAWPVGPSSTKKMNGEHRPRASESLRALEVDEGCSAPHFRCSA